ncbi:hypothetical protein B0919_21155 [Hymenobacter sp. CRA2]|nr:hypothetical protein B0919_21155 [Hymenobacter sp. CRA2]
MVGETCLDGILIKLDEQYPIGGQAYGHANVLAAVNFNDFGSLNSPGQRVYFTYTISTTGALRPCTANQAPIFALNSGKLVQVSNLSATGCP